MDEYIFTISTIRPPTKLLTHCTDVTAIEDTGTIGGSRPACHRRRLLRIPVYHEDIDNILGIVYVKDLLKYIGHEVGDNGASPT